MAGVVAACPRLGSGRRLRLRRSAGTRRVADRAGRVSGAGTRRVGPSGFHRDNQRVSAGSDAAGRRRRRDLRHGGPGCSAASRGGPPCRGTSGAAAGRRSGRPHRSRRRSGAERGRGHPGPSVPDRPDAPSRATARPAGLGALVRRFGRRERLRRGVPLRPQARRRAAGRRPRGRGLSGHDVQGPRPGAADRLDGPAAPSDRPGGRRQAARRPPHRTSRPADPGRPDHSSRLRPAHPRLPPAIPPPPRPASPPPRWTFPSP